MSAPVGQPLVALNQIVKVYGSRQILQGLDLTLHEGDRVGVLGVNGAGKSTLMRIVAGLDTAFEGQRVCKKQLSMAYVAQEPPLDEDKTVRENIMLGARAVMVLLDRFDELNVKLAEAKDPGRLMQELEKVQHEIDAKNGWEIERQIEIAMEALCLPPDDAQVAQLSGGERRRVALARYLLFHPDLLVLDEPTNHLDAETIAWLEGFIREYHGTVLLVTHDRYFLDSVANRMLEVQSGTIKSYEGNYSDYLTQKARQEEIEARSEANRQKLFKRELDWFNKTPKGRQTKNQARIKNFKLLQEEPPPDVVRTAQFMIPEGPRLGNQALKFDRISKGYDGVTLIDDFSLDVEPGAIIGVVGPNGVGKTTLIRLILGIETPDAGSLSVGQNTVFTYIDQNRNVLDENLTVFENIAEGAEFIDYGKQQLAVRHYLARFLFTGPIQQTPVKDLSGGERNRVTLAKMLKKPGNFLILDEPTNDLDLMTLRVLEEALESYRGCALVVTHDRYFLDRIATGILAFEGGGKLYYNEGSYDLYRESRTRRIAEAHARGEKHSTETNRRQYGRFLKT